MMLHRIASNDTGYDARAVANALLDRAEASGMAVTNLALQKLVYFAHGLMLTRHGRALVDGYFEAWEHGPVHPVLYGAFKHSGREPIAERARRRDFRSGGLGAVVSATEIGSYAVPRVVRLGLTQEVALAPRVMASYWFSGMFHRMVSRQYSPPQAGEL